MKIAFTVAICVCAAGSVSALENPLGPYDRQVAENVEKLRSEMPAVRAGAAEALGFLRAYAAEEALIARLEDSSVEVRRQVTMALAWCGSRKAVGPLLRALDDEDWVTRRAAHVSLTNLTGMEFPFHSTASPDRRRAQAKRWRDWWAAVPADRAPVEVLRLLTVPKNLENLARGRRVTSSSTDPNHGPPSVLTDGRIGPVYWQTKNVPFPQWCTVDLGSPLRIARVVVHQYGRGPVHVMTEYDLATSLDNQEFEVVEHHKGETPATLAIDFTPRPARYVRITSYGSILPQWPTIFFEIEVYGPAEDGGEPTGPTEWQLERGLRALGALGGTGATEAVLKCLNEVTEERGLVRPPEWHNGGSFVPSGSDKPNYRPVVRAGIRALGRLREEAGFQALLGLLKETMWARYAAEALGDFGDRRAVPALLAAYPRYAKPLDGWAWPAYANVPIDDGAGGVSNGIIAPYAGYEDRALETPHAIAYALCRLPLDAPKDHARLRRIAPLVMANLPSDYDTMMLYEPEVGHLLTRHLLEQAGRRQEACEYAFELLGQRRRVPKPPDPATWSTMRTERISAWLPAVCTEKADLPRLVALLQHENLWVRIHAAKTLGWLGDRRAIEPIARLLAAAKPEADYGYNGTFKLEEYNDPAPRWREGLIRALGMLGAHEHTDLLVRILEDERSVMEIRHAAAHALADLDNRSSTAALRGAALGHPFLNVRHAARDALRSRGIELKEDTAEPWHRQQPPAAGGEPNAADRLEAIVFIKGSNDVPNTKGPPILEYGGIWRDTYVAADSGPAYRPGRNLYVLRPPQPDGKITPLTRFADGYVADPELSWDAKHVIFARRGQHDPWWQIYRINVDGSGLEQLTDGPYHHVGPAYLPDGRIVLGCTRVAVRDEYHGYAGTSLHIMKPDGSQMHPIATNAGRDNEPAVLYDGRIVFSRLEVFYSRAQTELTVHAMHQDGTQDVVLYGPERRAFWHHLDHGPRTHADGQEGILRHRVLRITQPRPMPDRRHIVVATQGGMTLIGPRRDTETIITPDNKTRAYTTPFPLPDGRILCAATKKTPERSKVDLGLFLLDPVSKRLDLIYNDPATADFEPLAIVARRPPMVHPTNTKPHGYSGRFFCSSVFATQEPDVPLRGRLVRLIEGMPVISRHNTHTSVPIDSPHWGHTLLIVRNHNGTFARVLGTAPLASDGSFHIEVPADRLMHLQVLDSDRRVLGNQTTWIYPRPGEIKSCVGCHENPHTTTRGNNPIASQHPPLDFLPHGDEFNYRAKVWFKGHMPTKLDERTRTVRAVNLLAR